MGPVVCRPTPAKNSRRQAVVLSPINHPSPSLAIYPYNTLYSPFILLATHCATDHSVKVVFSGVLDVDAQFAIARNSCINVRSEEIVRVIKFVSWFGFIEMLVCSFVRAASGVREVREVRDGVNDIGRSAHHKVNKQFSSLSPTEEGMPKLIFSTAADRLIVVPLAVAESCTAALGAILAITMLHFPHSVG